MKRTRSQDSVDLACFQWARVRRELEGLKEPQHAHDYLGAVRCTLGQRRDLHAGARSDGRLDQHFPEVYPPGLPTQVNKAFKKMPEPLQDVMCWHYVLEAPRSRSLRARLVGISPRAYWERVGRAKDFVGGYLAAVESVRSEYA